MTAEMTRIGQRTLRNESGAVMRGLTAGDSYVITSNGHPVGVLRPANEPALDSLTARMPRRAMEVPAGIERAESSDSIVAELRHRQ